MTTGEIIQTMTLGVVILSGLGIPFLMRSLNRQDASRTEMKAEIHERLNHLDECLDDLKDRVGTRAVTRDEFLQFKVDVTEIINRQRAAISAETHGLHERLLRLENHLFKF